MTRYGPKVRAVGTRGNPAAGGWLAAILTALSRLRLMAVELEGSPREDSKRLRLRVLNPTM